MLVRVEDLLGNSVRTDQPAYEQTLRLMGSMLDGARIAFFAFDRELNHVAVNSAMAKLYSDRVTSVLGRPLSDLVAGFTAFELECLVRDVFDGRTQTRERQLLWAPLTGEPTLSHISLMPLDVDRGAGLVLGAVQTIKDTAATRRVAKAAALIHSNVGARLDILAMARRFGVSASQLQRDFQAALGVSPNHYITLARFQRALERLKAGDSIANVAHACGYADQSAFTRRFKAALGLPPTAYFKRMTELGRDPRADLGRVA